MEWSPPSNQWRHSLFQRLRNGFCSARAGIGDLLEITGVRAAKVLGLGDVDGNVAAVTNMVAKSLKPCCQTRNTHRRGPHVDAAPAGSHVERHSKHANAPGRQGLGSAGGK